MYITKDVHRQDKLIQLIIEHYYRLIKIHSE